MGNLEKNLWFMHQSRFSFVSNKHLDLGTQKLDSSLISICMWKGDNERTVYLMHIR